MPPRSPTATVFRLPTDAATWTAVVYLSMAGTVLAFFLYFSLLKTWSVMSLAFISVFTPAIALLLGFVFLEERPSRWTVAGSVLIIVSIALVARQGRVAVQETKGAV